MSKRIEGEDASLAEFTKGKLYLTVLNNVLASATSRWRTGITRHDIVEDSVILNALCDIARESGYGLDVEFKDAVKLTNNNPDFAGKHRTHFLIKKTQVSVPSSAGEGKAFLLSVNKDFMIFKRRRKEVKLNRKNIVSIKAVKRK